jgi:hypothetical protein
MASTTRPQSLRTQKINNVKCSQIPTKGDEDKRPIKGHEIIPELYANIGLFGKKKKGKTTAIFNIIKRCAGRDTSVIAFVSTIHKDAGWIGIKDYCESKGLPFIGYTSLKDDDGIDQLGALVKHLQTENVDDDSKEEPAPPPLRLPCLPAPGMEPATETKKQRKTPYQAPEYIIILDDLADELKSPSVSTLLKKNRHFKFKMIISSQWLNDLPPMGLGMMSVVCIFNGFSVEKLEELRGKLRLPVTEEEFASMYKDATSIPYGFLYIDTDSNQYRSKFDKQYDIGSE